MHVVRKKSAREKGFLCLNVSKTKQKIQLAMKNSELLLAFVRINNTYTKKESILLLLMFLFFCVYRDNLCSSSILIESTTREGEREKEKKYVSVIELLIKSNHDTEFFSFFFVS